MTQTHKVATDALDTLGTHPIPADSGRDAIHLAVEPAICGEERLYCAQPVRIVDGVAVNVPFNQATGIVDPFLEGPVYEGQRFWLVVKPRTITSLRHVWSHPAFPEETKAVNASAITVQESKAWMQAWANRNMKSDYYSDYDGDAEPQLSDERAYANAIEAGYDLNVGPYESARDEINDEWWTHWENITGGRGQRGEYFSCAC